MSRQVTDIIFILDRSGSMGGLENDTIGGFNSFIASQTQKEGDTFLTTVLFDDKYEVLWDRVLANTVTLTTDEYYVRGSTALLDAIGKTITSVDRRLTQTPRAEHPDQVIVVITTDGQENSSREHSYDRIKEMIEHQKTMHNWEFVFLGANIDVEKEAAQMGISKEDTIVFEASTDGLSKMYQDLNCYISEKRK